MIVSLQPLTPTERAAEVGRAARALREAHGWTRAELGARADVPVPTLRKFETSGLAPFLTVVRLAEALGVDGGVDALFRNAPSEDDFDALVGRR
jgi:transcriptional regulator with XRE-family HTH domain